MTCSTCGAQMSVLDTSCARCGAAVRSMVLPSPPSTSARMVGEAAVPIEPEAPVSAQPSRTRRIRGTTALGVVAIVAVIAAAALGAWRWQAAGALASTEGELADARTQLAASAGRVDDLGSEVERLGSERDELRTQLGDARAAEQDARRSLTSCQEYLRFAVDLVRTGIVSPGAGARSAADLVSCFEGKVPPSFF